MITLRSVKGSNLTPSEVDTNFSELDARVSAMEDDPPTGIGVTGFSVNGSTFTVNLSNGSTFGPFDLPYATMTWAGIWTAGDSYAPLSLFYVPSYGLYLTLQAYEAPTDFDPDEENTEGLLLRQLMGASVPLAVNDFTDDHVLTAEDLGSYVTITKPTATLFGVPLNASVPAEVGSTVTIRQGGAGQIAIDPLDSSIVINTPETLLTRKQFATVTLILVAPDTWDLAGDLELV